MRAQAAEGEGLDREWVLDGRGGELWWKRCEQDELP